MTSVTHVFDESRQDTAWVINAGLCLGEEGLEIFFFDMVAFVS